MPAPLLIVDGFHLLYRSWWGFSERRITARDGRDLTGVFGFFAILRKTHLELASDHEIVVAFDGEHAIETRQAVDPGYKAARATADHTAVGSLPSIKDGLDGLGICWAEFDDREGDDVIASLTAAATAVGRRVSCYSGDRDLLQLVDREVSVLTPARRWVTPDEIWLRFEVQPWQWPDYRALTGDPSDGIPGVRGIGPRTAARLLTAGAQLEDLVVSELRDHPRAARLATQWDQVLRWRDLIRLDRTIAVEPLTGNGTPALPLAARVLEELRLW